MNRYHILLLLMLVCLSGRLQAQSPDPAAALTLARIWHIAETQSRQIRLADLERTESVMDIQIARDRLLPEASVSGSYNLNTKLPVYQNGFFSKPDYFPVSKYGYGFSYLLNLNLYNGGRDVRNIQARKEENILQQNEFDLQRNNVRYAIATAYYDLYKFLQYRDFMAAEIAAEKKQLATIESLYRNGTILKSDVLRAATKLSQLQLSYSDVDKRITVARERLNIFIGRDNDTPLVIPYKQAINPDSGAVGESSYMDYVNIALSKSPEYKIAQNGVNLSKLNIKQAKSELLPTLSLFSNYNLTYPQVAFYPYSRNLWGFGQTGLKLTLSIDNFYKTSHTVAKARSENAQQAEKLQIKKDELTLDIREAFLAQQQAVEGVKTAEENIRQVTESVRIIKNSYLSQQSLLTDLLDAENTLLEAQFALTSAKINVALSHIRLLVKSGIL